ncbi:MAG TPA: hydrogen peroxide-dependent heme synthase [Symbiobacteriaceae bacterium]|nr:hydrogen peroxide-dependent heme synthase [Symbiobacteriaceae bacterium]
MAEVPGTLEGWYALHDFRRLDWPRWNQLTHSEQAAIVEEAAAWLSRAANVADAPEGSSAFYSIIGHKADLLLIHLRPTIDQLGALERSFNRTRLAGYTTQVYSYVSVTELSLYEASARGGSEDPEELKKNPFVQKRLKPQIPAHPYVCFYPMNKRRGEVVNWYAADMEERRRMMREHGTTGRKYAEQITQMITGSTGLDDWEWGVTLFGVDALPIKKLVYEMRFDEVSAKYAEFGAFQIGVRFEPQGLSDVLMG